ncbi:nucleotidyltransferase domain-containing protein [Rhodomicrobium lacus]|uniref:nucleotidyltransferase domain-containing protein n=1 Tax=Rhodomicrobium lacus TaxID=2498452 RepID=UPI000F8D6BB0|nr:nucleotidyltransferase domain-containing protein [Rhodomicrobium lacus]
MNEMLHVYAFGSICRGEILPGSDVDLLAVTTGSANQLSRAMFSIYSHAKIARIWADGNPFAWHLHLEAKLIYGSDDRDFFFTLGSPATYNNTHKDCERFLEIFRQARNSAEKDSRSIVFDLSAVFLALRNFSSCYLLGRGCPNFSRGVALDLMGDHPPIELNIYRILERARLLSTRGYGAPLDQAEISEALKALPALENWMSRLKDRENDQR